MAMAQPRVIIVGAGPAGARAAETLVGHGLRPVVIDEAPKAGGQIYRQQPDGFQRSARSLYGFEAGKAQHLHATFNGLIPNIDYRPRTLAWNAQNGILFTVSDNKIEKLPFDVLILATGATDRMYPVAGWTLPGVYTLGGAQIALKHQGCSVGESVVFAGSSPLLYLVAYQYAKAGAHVAAVLDTTPFAAKIDALGSMAAAPMTLAKGLYYMAALKRHGVSLQHGVTPIAIEGDDHVTAIRYRTAKGVETGLACRAVACGYGIKPEAQLAEIAGSTFRYAPEFRQWLPDCDSDGRTKPGLYLAGDCARIGGADAAEASGRLAALAFVADYNLASVAPDDIRRLRRTVQRMSRFQAGQAKAFQAPLEAMAALPDTTVVCRCEKITAGEIRRVTGEPLRAVEMNRVKAFCRAGMGRCQGRFCGLAAAEIVAAKLGTEPGAVGRLRAAGPVKPLRFDAAESEQV